MRQLIFVLVIAAVVSLAALVIWLTQVPGGVEIDMFGWEASIPTAGAILVVITLGGVSALVWSLAAGLVSLPGKIGKGGAARRARKANRALADGLLAAEAGDAAQARRLAKRASSHADDERLKLLLEARAAEAENDWISAERAWGMLARLPGGQMAGLRGAAAAAMERGDRATAEINARDALQLANQADWPFTSLFNLQVAKGDWTGALQTLAKGEKKGVIKGDPARRRRAVLNTALAAGLPPAQSLDAQKALAEAIKASPGFPPAAWYGARRLMIDGKMKAAEGILESAWKTRPHPALARLSRTLGGAEGLAERLQRLVAANPDHRESRILQAELDMDAERWEPAIRTLALLVEEQATARLCLLLERALKGYGDPEEAAHWARTAASAAREADWSDLDPKGGAFNFSQQDWSRLVFTFGDAAQLVHPRHEAFGRELEAGRPIALPAPDVAGQLVKPPLPKPASDDPVD